MDIVITTVEFWDSYWLEHMFIWGCLCLKTCVVLVPNLLHFQIFILSPWTNNVELLESTVSPLSKVALHWMLVLLYSTDILMKTSAPSLDIGLNSFPTLVRLRSSSLVPFINHWTLVIITDRDPQLNTGLRPGMKTLPWEVTSTRSYIVDTNTL